MQPFMKDGTSGGLGHAVVAVPRGAVGAGDEPVGGCGQ